MPGPAADGAGAGVGRFQPGEDAQEGGLAGPVRADQPDPLAGPQVERQVGEQRPRAEALGQSRTLSRTLMVNPDAIATGQSALGMVTARERRPKGCTLVTHNHTEFSRVPGLLIEDWETP